MLIYSYTQFFLSQWIQYFSINKTSIFFNFDKIFNDVFLELKLFTSFCFYCEFKLFKCIHYSFNFDYYWTFWTTILFLWLLDIVY